MEQRKEHGQYQIIGVCLLTIGNFGVQGKG